MKQILIFIISLLLAIGITALIFGKEGNLFFSEENHTRSDDLEHFCRETTVSGQSMEPTLYDGDSVCAYSENPGINDLVVFKCKHCGLDEPSVKRLKDIKDGCYWVEGDNPQRSYDSRQFGFLCPGNLEYIWKAKKE